MLHEMKAPPKRLQPAIISRLKIQSNMSISEHRVPQDGRIQTSVGGKLIDLRVSCLPTNHGESIVMRILDKEGLRLGLPELGFFTDDQQTFERLIGLPDGILLVTGPTGSGKTTTLYSCLNFINRPDRKIITVEDPVEYVLAGINQVQVNEAVGLSFAFALRAILRLAAPSKVVSLDPSEGFLDHARLMTKDARVEFRRGADQDVRSLGLIADAVVSGLVLNFVPDPIEALRAAAEVTAAGGLIGARSCHLSPSVPPAPRRTRGRTRSAASASRR